jgi:hypothetical protein
LTGTVTKEVYDMRFHSLEQERGALEAGSPGHEQANGAYFEQMESFLETARSIHRLFEAGDL